MPGDRIVFGLGGAWGFAPKDLTSPARAAGAGSLADCMLPDDAPGFTELRVHGVSGSTGPVMLEHPAALQVAGDTTTMFYRRWTPAGRGGAGVPWKLEAYSWGGLTEAPLASACWLLFAPFMLYNVAHFALPPQQSHRLIRVRPRTAAPAAPAPPDAETLVTLVPPGAETRPAPALPADAAAAETTLVEEIAEAILDEELAVDRAAADGGGPDGPAPALLLDRDAWHGVAAALLRLLAFSATLQFTSVIVAILVSSAALQAPNARLWSWLAWYAGWPAGGRVALALGAVALVFALMWLISVKTAHRYEARTSVARPDVNQQWPLTQTRFWKGAELVQRQRGLHLGGALAFTALIVSRPGPHMGGGRLALLVLSALVLGLVTVSLCLPLADRHNVTMADRTARVGGAPGEATRGTLWSRLMLVSGAGVFAGAFFTSGWPAEDRISHRTVPGFTNVCAFLLVAQVVLLVLVALTGWKLARSAPAQDPATRPFAGGHLTALFALLAVLLGGVMGALATLFATRVLGTPVPSGIAFHPPPANALQVPWPIYAFAAAPIGLVAGLLIGGAWVGYTWLKHAGAFAAPADGGSDVARFYGRRFGDADAEGFHGTRTRIARAWATGLLVDQAAVLVLWAVLGMVAATGWAAIYAVVTSGHAVVDQQLHGFAAVESVLGLFLAGLLVALLRADYSNPAQRKTIGAIWDVGTFWPRATHPFAPPCYAERAVPELVDRVRILAGTVAEDPADPAWQQIAAHLRDADSTGSPGLSVPPGPVLLTGYSQGSVIAPAVVAQLPDDGTLRQTALLTLACPVRRLYGRAFPAYFGLEQRQTLARLLDTGEGGPPVTKWKNLVRRTDYIGSWIFGNPAPGIPDPVQIQPTVDQPCWDPVSLSADVDPTPPAIHYHSGFWPDPRVTQLGRYLGETSFRLSDPARR
jgi:hypothetical protein